MLNKWTILFQIKETRDRRTNLIYKRTKEAFRIAVHQAFFAYTPLLSRLRNK